ncbi:hypothetical protein DID88_007567 [Monilinia fructigena]|uniref:Uncharacterized protein n=1 Tax=Monilinia fructigena TaxID=38457 RepID=A0A395J3U6_9HELO|nr:hypothetical protein DID88_007567 [Monilinia fructigena]
MQHNDAAQPIEYNDDDYFREVLQLEGKEQTEILFDERLNKEAEKLGISLPGPSAGERIDDSLCESPFTQSYHTHTASSISQDTDSTDLTSRSSNEILDISSIPQPWKRPTSRRSLSFHGYEKYVKQIDAQTAISIAFADTCQFSSKANTIPLFNIFEALLCQP